MNFTSLFLAITRRLKEDKPSVFFYRAIRHFLLRFIQTKNKIFIKKIRKKLKNKYVIENVLGNKMYLDLENDDGISFQLYKLGIREPFITKAIQKEIKERDTVIDIGANIGYYVLLESKLVGQKGKVYAIEPISENIELLKKNIELNKVSNVEIYQLAIGDKHKFDYIYISKCRNICSMIRQEKENFIKKIPIEVFSLDEFLKNKPKPDLIRMDVEGYEFEIIKGMEKTLQSKEPLKILMEIHPHILKEKIVYILQTLKENNFVVKIATQEPWPCILRESKFVQNILDFLGERIDFRPGLINLNLEDLLNDKLLVEGRRPCWEILFERK